MAAPSTTASPPTASSAPGPALTTPYIFPSECSNTYNLTSRSALYQSFASLSETFLYINTSHPHFQSCQPTGRLIVSQHFHQTAYSGIVCPSGWTAWNVGLQSKFIANAASSTWSTAFCCGNGHTLVDDIWSIYSHEYNRKICIETFPPSPSSPAVSSPVFTTGTYTSSYPFFVEVASASATPSSSGSSTPESIITRTFSTHTPVPLITTFSGRAFYPPWSVEWEAGDNPTLSPTWPVLTRDMLIPSWVPGEEVMRGVFDYKGAGAREVREEGYEKAWALPVMVTLGVLLGLSLLGLGVLGWTLRRVKREVRWREDVKDGDEMLRSADGYGDGNGLGVVGPGHGAHARKVSVSNGERARVVDVRRSRRSNQP